MNKLAMVGGMGRKELVLSRRNNQKEKRSRTGRMQKSHTAEEQRGGAGVARMKSGGMGHFRKGHGL